MSRRVLGPEPGDELIVKPAEDEARARPIEAAADLRGLLGGGDSLAELAADHRHELERDAVRPRGPRG